MRPRKTAFIITLKEKFYFLIYSTAKSLYSKPFFFILVPWLKPNCKHTIASNSISHRLTFVYTFIGIFRSVHTHWRHDLYFHAIQHSCDKLLAGFGDLCSNHSKFSNKIHFSLYLPSWKKFLSFPNWQKNGKPAIKLQKFQKQG